VLRAIIEKNLGPAAFIHPTDIYNPPKQVHCRELLQLMVLSTRKPDGIHSVGFELVKNNNGARAGRVPFLRIEPDVWGTYFEFRQPYGYVTYADFMSGTDNFFGFLLYAQLYDRGLAQLLEQWLQEIITDHEWYMKQSTLLDGVECLKYFSLLFYRG
jgi:hypothetical protein